MNFSRKLEEKTVSKMIEIYCRKAHDSKSNTLCPNCSKLLDYAGDRIEHCPHGERKPVCAKCKVHCYKPLMRTEIKKVMRYSGPKMIYKSPFLSLRYLFRKVFKS